MTTMHKLDLRLQNIPSDIWKGIAAIDEMKGRWTASAKLHPQVLSRLKHSVLVTSTGASTRIEGAMLSDEDIEKAKKDLNDADEVDLVAIGCPHLSLREVGEVAHMLKGKKVRKETWLCVARPIKRIADQMGYTKMIEDSGAKFACDTCMAVAPLKGRFRGLATDSAKGCFYGRGSNAFKTKFMALPELIEEATR